MSVLALVWLRHHQCLSVHHLWNQSKSIPVIGLIVFIVHIASILVANLISLPLSAERLAFQWRKGWKCLRTGGTDAAGGRRCWNGNASKWLLSLLLCIVSAAVGPWVCVRAPKWSVSCSLWSTGSYKWCRWPVLDVAG